MTDNRNEVTVDNSVLILIDHQPWVAFGVTERHKVNPAVMKNDAGVVLDLEQAFAQT